MGAAPKLQLLSLAACLAASTLSPSLATGAPRACLSGALSRHIISPWSLTLPEFKRLYAIDFRPPVSPAANNELVNLARDHAARARLWFEMENPILKEMNDRLFRDQDVASAVTNLYKEIFFRRLQEKRLPVIARYSDYKSVRLALSEDTPGVRQALAELYSGSAAEFNERLSRLRLIDTNLREPSSPFLSLLPIPVRGIAGDPAAWQLAGVGRTLEEAGISARVARHQFPTFLPGRPELQEFDRIGALLDERVDQIEALRRRLARQLPPPMLVTPPGAPAPVLAADVLEILRKTKASDIEGYRRALRTAIRERFGFSPSNEQLLDIRSYVTLADTFSPGLLHEANAAAQAVPAAPHGSIHLDFKGLGARNLEATLVGLARASAGAPGSSEQKVQLALRETQEAVAEVSRGFVRRKEELNNAFAATERRVSGDEYDAYLPGKTRRSDRAALARDARAAAGPSDLRSSYVPPKYPDGLPISDTLRKKFKEEALSLEKAVRGRLQGGPGAEKLRESHIHVDYYPDNEAGGGIFNLILSGPATQDRALAGRIKKALNAEIGIRKLTDPRLRAGRVFRKF